MFASCRGSRTVTMRGVLVRRAALVAGAVMAHRVVPELDIDDLPQNLEQGSWSLTST
ncbi:MAG: hypothetical protein M5T61_20880 [Acidimicrobiia bacterium]|nr:hypothetical protein [Acidimicrobiia bacterium]